MKKIAMAVFIAMVIASCAKEEKSENAELEQITLSATFATSPSAEIKPEQTSDQTSDQKPEHQTESRATATAFEANDELGLFVVKSGMEVQKDGNLVNNHKMVVGSDGVIKGTPTAVYYPTSSSQVTSPSSLYSYYPYQSGDATADALGVLVGIRTDQTDFLDVKRSDLCFGSARDITPAKVAQPITFKHSFAQVRVNVALYNGCPAVKQLRLINVKDSALLNIQTGAISLKSHTAEVLAYKSAENSYSTIIPAQTLNGACIAIDLVDNKTTYIYNAINPISLTQSATNTLNITINDKGIASLNGTPSVTAWGVKSVSSPDLSQATDNTFTFYWSPAITDFNKANKAFITLTNPTTAITKRFEVTSFVVDPLSTAANAIYRFSLPSSSTQSMGYPVTIDKFELFNNTTPIHTLTDYYGKTITKPGAHTFGTVTSIKLNPTGDWANVANTAQSRVIAVTTTGNTAFVVDYSPKNAGLTATKNADNTATISWAAQITNGDSPARSGTVTFTTVPAGVSYSISTNQLIGPYYFASDFTGAWSNVANTTQSKVLNISTGNLTDWTAAVTAASNGGLTATKTAGAGSGAGSARGTATISWAAQAVGSIARTGTITLTPTPNTAPATPITIATNQVAGPAPTLTLSAYGPGVTVPKGGGTYYVNVTSNTAWTVASSYPSYVSISPTSGTGNVNSVRITVAATSLSTTRSVNAVFKTNAVPSGATASQTWSGTQESAGPENAVNINGTWWSLSNTGADCNWDTAMTRCVSPWRLPSKTDFESLINSGRINETGMQSDRYWSSTESEANFAWYLSNGILTNNRKVYSCYVRCCQ